MINRLIFILCLLLSSFSFRSNATIVYVDSAHVGGTQNGISWATAFSNFQTAIDSARSGDSIWVAKGTYKPALSGSSFGMKDSVKILGGFLNTHTSLSQRNWAANTTILRGNGDLVILNSFSNILTAEALLDGFTITGGTGGGMENSFSSPTISNCTFSNNNGLTDGAAMQNNLCTSLITNCKFLNNQGTAGVVNAGLGAFPPDNGVGPAFVNCLFSGNSGTNAGGVVNANCMVTYTNCDFTNNTGTVNAGGMYNTDAIINMNNCNFTNNKSPQKGGGMYQDNCISTITNCHFTGNSAQYGGGIANEADTAIHFMTLSNSTFTNNKAIAPGPQSLDQLYGGGVYNRNRAIVSNCTFSNNTAGYLNSGAAGGGFYNRATNNTMISTISNCNFYNNKATVDALTWWASGASGGGLSGYYCNLYNCLFDGNQATIAGGGIAVSGQTALDGFVSNCKFIRNRSQKGGGVSGTAGVKIMNCLVVKNVADSFGGGMYIPVYQQYNTNIVNNTITQNKATYSGGGIYFYAYTAITNPYAMSNNIVWGNNSGIAKLASIPDPVVTYSLIQGMPADAVKHNLDGAADPLMVDTAAENYQLLAASPCINAGRNDSLPAVFTTDLANHTRIYNGTIDLGAYEYGIFQPVVALGNDTAFCAGSSFQLNAPYLAATSYFWNTGAITQQIQVTTAGTYYVTVSNTAGVASDTIVISENSLPVVNLGNDTSFCAGHSLQLNAQNAGASYLWSTAANAQTITVNTSGNYWVTVTDANACKGSDTILVTVNPLPTVNLGNDTNIPQSGSLTLDAGNPGSTYLWNTGASTQTINVTTPGTYSVTVTNANSCSKTDAINIGTTGINDISMVNNAISIAPNPARETINIHINDPKILHTRAILTDAYGRIVSYIIMEKETQVCSVEGLASGVYILKMENGQAIKIVKQ